MLNYIELYWIILNYIILELFWITLIKLIEFYNVYKLTSTPSQWLLLENRYKGSISTLAQTLSIPELFNTQGRVLSDHTHKCSPGHASTAHKRHFLGPASAGLQPFVAAPRMVPAHVQSDSMMKDTNGTKYHITWKSALLWPNLLGLFCQNPLQVTVFCCLKRMTGAQRMRPLPKHVVFVPGCLGEKGCSPFPKLERILASSDLPWSMNRFCWKKITGIPKIELSKFSHDRILGHCF